MENHHRGVIMKKTLLKSFLIVGCVFFSIGFFSPSAYPYSDSGKVPSAWKVWSSWYFPYHDDYNPNLYDDDEAMSRYDDFVYYASGEFYYPDSQGWEYENHGPPQNPDPWWGHCHAWAGASVWEDQPKKKRKLEGITFRPRDRKGLMIESYFNCANGYTYDFMVDDPSPGLFWRYLRDEIKGIDPMHGHGMGFVGELYYGDEVWNYPIYKYKVSYKSDDYGLYGTMKVYVATDSDPSYADSNGLHSLIFTYYFSDVEVYDEQPVDSGYWLGEEDDPYHRPDAIWRPYYPETWTYYTENGWLEEDYLGAILNP
jgi:hypothetical protein